MRRRSALISPTRLYVHGVVTPSQPAGVAESPAKWSPSSTVNTNSVLRLLIPSAASRSKNLRNASLLHLRHPGKGHCGLHAVKAWEADMSGRVLDHVAVESGHRSTWLND